MAVGLIGCGSNTQTGASAEATSAANTATTQSAEAASSAAAAATSEAATAASSDATGEVKKLTCFINMPWYPVNSFTGKIPEAIKAATGVDLDVTIATDNSQLGVMISSGELPDIIFTDGNLSELSNSDVCYSLDDLSKATGVSFEDSMNYEDRTKIAQSLADDQQAYTLLNAYSSQAELSAMKIGAPGQACMYYRKDLLDAKNIAVPTTMDEFVECLKKVKEAYPDKTPFGLGGYWKFQVISNWCGVSAGTYDGTTYKYDASTDAYKDYLKYCNTLYRDGFVTAEDYANEKEEDSHQKAYNDGDVFYTWFLGGSNYSQLQSNSVSSDAQWKILAPLGKAPINTNKGWAGMFVSKNCSDPEAAAKLFAFLNSETGSRLSLWGIEGEDYTLDSDGVPQFSDEYLKARSDGDTFNKEYNTNFGFGYSDVESVYQNYSGMDKELLDQFNAYGVGIKNYPSVGIASPSSTSDMGVIKTKLMDITKKYEAKVIFTDNDDDFEAAYKEYMAALDSTGVKDYNDYMTKQIAKVKSDYGFEN